MVQRVRVTLVRSSHISRITLSMSAAEIIPTTFSSWVTNTRWIRPLIMVSATCCTVAFSLTLKIVGVMMSRTVIRGSFPKWSESISCGANWLFHPYFQNFLDHNIFCSQTCHLFIHYYICKSYNGTTMPDLIYSTFLPLAQSDKSQEQI